MTHVMIKLSEKWRINAKSFFHFWMVAFHGNFLPLNFSFIFFLSSPVTCKSSTFPFNWIGHDIFFLFYFIIMSNKAPVHLLWFSVYNQFFYQFCVLISFLLCICVLSYFTFHMIFLYLPVTLWWYKTFCAKQ